MKHFDLIVTGKVQRVGLRFMSLKKAYELRVKGYVKYMKDKDKVGMEIEGEEENLEEFMYWLRKRVKFAEITSIDIQEGDIRNYPTFEIIHKTSTVFQHI